MSETKHTPGPWRIDPATGRIVANSMSVGRAVALDVAKTFPRRGQVETNANAHLIAAAPDLLEAAAELLKQWDAFEASSGNMEEAYYKLAKYARPSWAKAMAAIAKAEGRSASLPLSKGQEEGR